MPSVMESSTNVQACSRCREGPARCQCARNTPPPQELCPGEPGDLVPGMRLADYVLQERIGAGGMGVVFRAIHPLIGKEVAIKFLLPQTAGSSEEIQRLLTEARAVNAIQHRGIIDIFGFGALPDGRQYMVMEFLRGVPLDAYLRQRGRLEFQEAGALLEEVLEALGAAHGAGVIHRDIKPSNIFLVEQPRGTREVRLLDFGIAKLVRPFGDTPRTVTGQMLGTPGYMSPEQARGEPIGPATDLYAVGALAFKLLTGVLPFRGSEPLQMVMRQQQEDPPAPSSLAPGIPRELDALVLQLLAKRPEQRPASADEVRRSLQHLRQSWAEPETLRGRDAALATSQPHSASLAGSLKWLVPLGGLLTLAGVLLGCWIEGASRPRHEERPEANPPPPVLGPPVVPRTSTDTPVAAEAPPSPAPSVAPLALLAREEGTPAGQAAASSPTPLKVERRKKVQRTPLERIEQLEEGLKQEPTPSPIAAMLLKKARQDALSARTVGDRKTLHRFLDDWERKFSRR